MPSAALLLLMKHHCQHWLPKKKRFCHFEPSNPAVPYCNHHLPKDSDRPRVACPIDPNHTVWADELQKHLKKCPALRFVPIDKPYYRKDANLDPQEHEGTARSGQLQTLSTEHFQRLVGQVDDLYSRSSPSSQQGRGESPRKHELCHRSLALYYNSHINGGLTVHTTNDAVQQSHDQSTHTKCTSSFCALECPATHIHTHIIRMHTHMVTTFTPTSSVCTPTLSPHSHPHQHPTYTHSK